MSSSMPKKVYQRHLRLRRPVVLFLLARCGQDVDMSNGLESTKLLEALRECQQNPEKQPKFEQAMAELERQYVKFRDAAKSPTDARSRRNPGGHEFHVRVSSWIQENADGLGVPLLCKKPV